MLEINRYCAEIDEDADLVRLDVHIEMDMKIWRELLIRLTKDGCFNSPPEFSQRDIAVAYLALKTLF